MSGDVETEAPRPRPLSGGLWTLFSWLRREERSSSESISSAGSDRTAASFAFLAPENYRTTSTPLVLPPDGPPTDSYKKRVRDRNLRRHHDRDLTLRRKYGLFRDIEGYDAFSLPSARRTTNESGAREDRERRATSECLYRRAAYVPGKRRAPPPPFTCAASAGPSASLPRRHSRKRPAPQPPVNLIEKPKENTISVEQNNYLLIQMNAKSTQNKDLTSNNDITMGCKSEKYSKKDSNSKDRKLRSEKSFLKQIFENKKRNSTIDIMSVKVLPSISELDKQATELIETYKTKELNNNVTDGKHVRNNCRRLSSGDVWICTRCLKKYEASVVTCVHCFPKEILIKEMDKSNTQKLEFNTNISTQTENKLIGTPSTSKVNEREKLKEMLKEMKDSLPKRSKNGDNHAKKTNKSSPSSSDSSSSERKISVVETPTLRIGTCTNDKTPIMSQKATADPILLNCNNKNAEILYNKSQVLKNARPPPAIEKCGVTQVVLVDTHPKDDKIVKKSKSESRTTVITKEQNISNSSKIAIQLERNEFTEHGQRPSNNFKDKKDLHTPLKISALLNPVHITKNDILYKQDSQRKTCLSQAVPTSSKLEMKPITTNVLNVIASSLSQPSSSKADNPKETNSNQERQSISSEKHSLTKEIKKTQTVTLTAVPKPGPSLVLKQKATSKLPSSNQINGTPVNINTSKERFSLAQHIKRRELITQLEQSIAKGDELAAADAASKLAQLKLSCSVLSFSSQIVGETSPFPSSLILKNENDIEKVPQVQKTPKIENTTKLSIVSEENIKQTEHKNDERTKHEEIKVKHLAVKTEAADSKKVSQRLIEASTSKNSTSGNENDVVLIEVFVEDKDATRGPVRLQIHRQATMGDLRRQAETTLGVPVNLQRWIVGRALCTDDTAPIIALAGSDFKAQFYLCLVEEINKETVAQTKQEKNIEAVAADEVAKDNGRKVYTELVQLEQRALVPNAETFQCDVCIEACVPGGGAVLRECVHAFCRECLADVVRHSQEPVVACPAMGCSGVLQEREIRALVSSEEYERWLARGLATAESGIRNSFHCRTRDCTGWALCEPGVRRFPCPVCKHINCVPCQAIHEGDTCEQHRNKLQEALTTVNASGGGQTDESTRALLENLISKGEALECPECSAIITKKWGCDWVKCSACKTEICWVTRGRRWGPAGRGDTSAGCRCGVDGKRCHPSCGYCH